MGVTILSLWDGDKKERSALGADSRAKLDVRDAEVAGSNPVVPTHETYQKQHLPIPKFPRDIFLTEGWQLWNVVPGGMERIPFTVRGYSCAVLT